LQPRILKNYFFFPLGFAAGFFAAFFFAAIDHSPPVLVIVSNMSIFLLSKFLKLVIINDLSQKKIIKKISSEND